MMGEHVCISPKENMLRMLNHEVPDFVPYQPEAFQMIRANAMHERPYGYVTGYDWFGVHWTSDGGLPVPTAGVSHVLEDITLWKEQVEFPDLDNWDWESDAKRDCKEQDSNKLTFIIMGTGPFERLHALMGFEEALCALITNPEECGQLFSAVVDFKIKQMYYLKKYYHVDMVHFHDDWGSQKDLFFHPDIWRTLIKPQIQRAVDAAHELGIYFIMHSCGKIDRIANEIADMGIDILDPAQPINDLARWKREFGHKVAFMGGIDAQNVVDNPACSEEEIRKEVREKIDLLAPQGGYIPFAVAVTPRNAIALDEIKQYGRDFYYNSLNR
jgi:Uroporphyrinogen decarboxylase (URO-D)